MQEKGMRSFYVCQKGVSRQQLGELFRIRSWAFSDPLIGETTEQADFWFRTSATMKPDRIRSTGISIAHSIDNEGWVHFTLSGIWCS